MRKILFLFLALLSTIGAWADPVSSVSQLSNSKCYTVVTERGAWWADLTNNKPSYQASITTPANVPNQDAYKFAIIKQGESFFLYSLAAQKFIHPRYNFVTMMPTPLTIEDMANSKMKMMSSNPNKAVNIGGGQWTWDTWTNTDGGNLLTISEVGDFDPTAALAMLTTTQVYTVTCKRGSWAVTSERMTGNGASGILTNQQFALFVNEGKMYLYSVGAEKFVKSDGSLFEGKGDPITFNLTGDTSYPYQFYFPLATQIYFNMQGGGSNIIFNDYSSGDDGNKCQITSVTDADVAAITAKATEVFFGSKTITYNIKINGTTVATTTNEQKVGAAAELPSEYASKEYVTYSYSPTTIGVDTEEVEVTATVGTLPFEVSSDFDNAHWYNIKIGANQRYVAWEDSEPYHTHAEDEATENARAHAPYQWAFMGNPVTGIKVVNRHLGASYSLTSEGTGANVNNAEGIPNTVLRSGDHYWDIHQNNDGFSLNLIGKNNYYINTHGGPNGYFQIWQSSGAETDGGSRINVAEVPDLATTVTYNVTYGGSVAYTSTVPGVIGEELGALPYDVDLDYVTITGHDASAIITRDMVVNVTATWNGPFELSADYASAHWYDMAVRGNYYVTSDNKDVTNALAPIPANAMGLAEDAYQWAFVGNPYNIKLYNKAEGSTKVYAWTSNENSSIPAFVDAASGNCWWIKQSTSSISNAFLLTIPHDGYQVNQFGGSSGSLKIWNSTGTGDLGSAFTVFDVPDNFAEYATAEIKPYAAPTGYFALTDAAKASIGWQDSYETTCPYETYRDMKLALQAIDLTDMSNFNFPETGYYTLKNKNYGTYMGIDPSDANMYGNYATAVAAKQIVKLTKNSDNTYTIGLMGKFAPATVSQSAQVTANETAGNYTVVIPAAGCAVFKADPSSNMSCLHCAGGGSIVGWEAAAVASQWIVEDATSIELTIGAEGYATTYLPFPVEYGGTLPVPEAIGRWTFDDPADLLAGTGIATLQATTHAKDNVTVTDLATAGITTVEGPDASNGAVNVPVGSSLLMAANNGATSIGTYSIMYDVCVEDGSTFIPLLQNSLTDGKDGSLFINKNTIGLGGGLGYHGSIENNKWYRVVFVVQPNGASIYVDGNQLVSNLNLSTAYNQHWLLTTGALFFADEDGEEKAIKTSELRFWDIALDAEQVATLGSISGDAPKFPEALGVWTFEDATDPYAGIGTATLADWGNGVTFDSGVATVPVGAGMELNTNLTTTPTAYTLMQDVKFADVSGYISLFQNDVNNGKDGSIFIKNGTVGLASAGLGYNGTINTDTWYRIVTVIDNSYCTLYVDGVQVGKSATQDVNAWAMRDSRKLILFIDNDGEEKEVQLAEARFWDKALTAAQVAELATVGTTIDEGESKDAVAYTAQLDGSNKWLVLNKLDGTIPTKTAVVLKGAPKTYVYNIVAEASPITDNVLKGTLEPIEATGKYVLAKPAGEEVGFYLANSGDIAAGKAYLEINSEIKGFIFKFDDDATGIDDISDYNNAKNLNESKAIYNLAGQRLNKMQKGINIVNGKKIMVK